MTTTAAGNVTITSAALHGSVIPNELDTAAWFEWGTDSNLTTFSTTASQPLGTGNISTEIVETVALSAGTTYYFRVAAANSAGTSKGAILTFNTVAQPPAVTTAAATSLTIDAATLPGAVNPNGLATNAWAEWGTEPTLDTCTPTSRQNLGSGSTEVPFEAPVASLTPGTTYYFRVAATNSAGTSKGAIVRFTTTADAPTVTTAAATLVTASSVQLNGNVNPNGLATDSWFEWGTVANLASYTPTPAQSTGSGKANVPVNASLSSLSAGTTYYFRVAALNSAGTSQGTILTFTTFLPPTVTTKTPTSVTKTGALFNGEVNPNELSTNGWFEYGTDPSLASFNSTVNQNLGTGTTPVPFSAAVSLTAYTTYYYRAAASNSNVTQKGPIRSFLTGETYVALGDSITFGVGDDISGDGIGYEPILGDLLGAIVANEGVDGATSGNGAGSISTTLLKYPSANFYLVQYGTNDALIPPVPSGKGLVPGNPGYNGSYKDKMQKIISAILAAGKTPYLAKVPWTSYVDRSDGAIQEYNLVVDELRISNSILVMAPDLYTWFQSNPGQLADGIHPNEAGYQSMASLWLSALP